MRYSYNNCLINSVGFNDSYNAIRAFISFYPVCLYHTGVYRFLRAILRDSTHNISLANNLKSFPVL